MPRTDAEEQHPVVSIETSMQNPESRSSLQSSGYGANRGERLVVASSDEHEASAGSESSEDNEDSSSLASEDDEDGIEAAAYDNLADFSIQAVVAPARSWDICHPCLKLLAKDHGYNLSLPDISARSRSSRFVSLGELTRSAVDGCSLCKAICSTLASRLESQGLVNLALLPWQRRTNGERIDMSNDRPLQGLQEIEIERVHVTFSGERHRYFQMDFMIDVDGSAIEVVLTSELAGDAFQLRKANLDVSGDATFQFIKNCIQDCREDCEHCFVNISGHDFPSRMIDVSPTSTRPENISVISDFDANHGEYLTLSYCWGVIKQPEATTTENVAGRARDFAPTRLPATIQDAIHVTRRLGFRYLWVDSMCIIQDSPEDKKIEIKKMKSIYRLSFMTIIVACNTSVTESFMCEKQPLPSVGAGKIPFWDMENNVHDCELALIDQEETDAREPVHQRAWTLEEWLLPTRRLIYSKGQVGWSCRGFEKSDGGALLRGLPIMLRNWIGQDIHDDILIETCQTFWERIVHEYTGRTLTHSKDKLNAIDGLAQYIGQKTNLTYVCGLWLEYIIVGLCWSHLPMDLLAKPLVPGRSDLANCPTWSWGSVTFPVIGAGAFKYDKAPYSLLAKARVLEETLPHQLLVEGAFANVRHLNLVNDLERVTDIPGTVSFELADVVETFDMRVWPDTSETWPRKLSFLFLLQERISLVYDGVLVEEHSDIEKDPAVTLHGLVLAPHSTIAGVMCRIGYFQIRPAGRLLRVTSRQRAQLTIV